MNHSNIRVVTLLASGAIAAGFIGCDTQAQQNTVTSSPVSSPQATTTTPVDQRFIEMMIPHHQGAVEMAQIALDRAKRPEVRQLAQSIIQAQNQEIAQMQTWYKQWYGKEVPASTANNMGMDHSMHQGGAEMMPMIGMDMQALKSAADFDREFLKQMIPHHQSAIMMAQMVTDSAERPEIRNLAKEIVQSQNSEIAQMQKWLQAWN